MSSYPATTFRFQDRGQVREGFWADLVVFDPETVRDRATYTEPHQYPEGIPHVVVNGVVVLRDGQLTGARPGVVLRHGNALITAAREASSPSGGVNQSQW
jgi:N-acyl-D-amino-acid deacylase